MKRNYITSTILHIIAILLLLSFTFSETAQPKEVEHMIVIDFSDRPDSPRPKTPRGIPTAKPTKTSTAPEKKVKTEEPAKSVEKVNVPKTAVKTEPKAIKTDVIPQQITKTTQEESVITAAEEAKKKEEKRRAAEYQAKKSRFADLLKNARHNETVEDEESSDKSEATQGTPLSDVDHGIRGALGNRQVLHIPTITDNSQKKGRVVVKICVNSAGRVVSAVYTTMGSTTSDSYLIGLAEEGVKGYRFSKSPVPEECGKVTIDFLLK
ncbi:MAG: hypothetical protein AAFR14_09040 [Bacteroidota bacterium]